MLIVALVMAVIGLTALVTAFVTGSAVIAWVCIGASASGVVLLIVDTLRARQQPDAEPVATADGVLPFDADYPDYAASDRPPADAPIVYGDHEVQREIMHEERVLHLDTGPLDPDITEQEVREAIRHRPRHRSTHRLSR